MNNQNNELLKATILIEEEKEILKVLKEFWNWDNNPFNSKGNYEIELGKKLDNLVSFCQKWSIAVQELNKYGADHEYPNLGKVINMAPILRNLGEIFANLKRMTGQLKDYTDQELANELAKRINQFSLDPIYLLSPLVVAGSQYLDWYNAEKWKSQAKPATE